MVVGAGTVLDTETAQQCLDAGAKFLTSPGLVMEVVEFAVKKDVVVFPGVLTPTDVITAWKAGADFVKVFPCAQVGGPAYIRALKVPLPKVPLIASGGVNQQSAANFIRAGATAGHRIRVNPARGAATPAGGADPRTGAQIPGHGEEYARGAEETVINFRHRNG